MRPYALLLLCLFVGPGSALGQNPVPLINQPLVPEDALPGGPSFTLTVNGTGFVNGASVNWNRTTLPTTFLSPSQLTAAVPAANITSATTATVTVTNPGVGAASNAIYFPVSQARSLVTFVQAPGSPLWQPWGTAYASPEGVAAWDFDGDGKIDLAAAFTNATGVGGAGTLHVFPGNGDGTFTPSSFSAQVGSRPISMLAADFNGDGRADLAVVNGCWPTTPVPSNFIGNSVSVLLGKGDGTFALAAGSPVPVGNCPDAVAQGDFNGDGKLDLAVANGSPASPSSGSVTVLLGNGDGTFTPAPESPVPLGSQPMALAVGDFNGDGNLDLAIANWSGTLDVLLGNGGGAFTPAEGSPISVRDPSGGDPLYDLLTGDFNGDGKLDLAAAGWNNDIVFMFQGNGDGTFTEAPISGNPMWNDTRTLAMVEGDFYARGKLDLAMADDLYNISVAETGYLATMQGHGDGTLTEGEFSLITYPYVYTLVAADFNGDGKLDLAEPSSDVGIAIALQAPAKAAPSVFIGPAGAIPTQFPPGSTSQTVKAGGTATFGNLMAFSLNGYTGAPTLTCAGAPANATCTVTPFSIDLSAALLGYPFTLAVQTAAPTKSSSLPPFLPRGGWRVVLCAVLGGFFLLSGWIRTRRPTARSRPASATLLAAVLIWVALSAGCGSGPPQPRGTPPGVYTITVTAASANLAKPATATFTVTVE